MKDASNVIKLFLLKPEDAKKPKIFIRTVETKIPTIRRTLMAGKHSSRKWKKKGKPRWKTRKKKLRERKRKAKIRNR